MLASITEMKADRLSHQTGEFLLLPDQRVGQSGDGDGGDAGAQPHQAERQIGL